MSTPSPDRLAALTVLVETARKSGAQIFIARDDDGRRRWCSCCLIGGSAHVMVSLPIQGLRACGTLPATPSERSVRKEEFWAGQYMDRTGIAMWCYR